MRINYEIQSIKNSKGEDKEQKYVVLRSSNPLTDEEMEERIEASCTLTKADIRGVLTALRELAADQLSQGNRFHMPGIGWLSVSAGVKRDALEPGQKITGKDIFLSRIRFRPEAKFFNEVSRDVKFKREKDSSKPKEYDEEGLKRLLTDYFTRNEFLTSSVMQHDLGLSRYTTDKWLGKLVADDFLRKTVVKRNIYYMLAK